MFKSSNPALGQRFSTAARSGEHSAGVMTLAGTVDKSLLLLGILLIAATFSWQQSMPVEGQGMAPSIWLGLGAILGFITAMVTIFKPEIANITAPVYAAFEGLFLGAISAMFEVAYPGIAFQAVLATFAVFGSMLFMYRSGTLRATPAFQKGLMVAALGLFGIYLLSFIMGLFGTTIPFIHEAGPIGIGFSLFAVGLASLFLILDFDFIEKQSEMGAPKYMEWYGAFSLMVTLVWLYLEILKLISKLRSSD